MSQCSSCADKDRCPSAGQEACPGNEAAGAKKGAGAAPTLAEPHQLAQVRSVIGICSGKGGVGKSTVTAMTAVALARQGLCVGILDADVTGPSIPKAFGLSGQLSGTEEGIFPARTETGIQVISVNLMLQNPEAPVVWRGPVISGVVRQFWTDVIWDGLDVLLIDMPPGTGDVPLTIFQSIPLDGLIIVSTPQDLVSMIVRKARNMALMMQVKILGFVENMSHLRCPDCGHDIELFGSGHTAAAAAEMNVPLLDRLPVDPRVAQLCDEGHIEQLDDVLLSGTMAAVRQIVAERPV